jgi:hypothetical protein
VAGTSVRMEAATDDGDDDRPVEACTMQLSLDGSMSRVFLFSGSGFDSGETKVSFLSLPRIRFTESRVLISSLA